MSKSFFKKILILLCVLTLAGCSVFFVLFFGIFLDDFFFEESVTSKRLKEEVGIGEYKYLEEIYNGRWEKVCVLITSFWEIYYGGFTGSPNKKKEAFIKEKIAQYDLTTSGGDWHLLFFRNAHDDDYFDYISFRSSQELAIRQQPHNFSQKLIDDFKQAGFSPTHCAERDQAVMFKTKEKWNEYTLIEITLGVINDNESESGISK